MRLFKKRDPRIKQLKKSRLLWAEIKLLSEHRAKTAKNRMAVISTTIYKLEGRK